MVLLEQIARSFGDNPVLNHGAETFRDGDWTFTVTPWRLPTIAGLVDALAKIPERDSLRISVSAEGASPVNLSSRATLDVTAFLSTLKPYHESDGALEKLDVKLNVSKHVESDELSVYNLELLERSLDKLNNSQLLAVFDQVCSHESSRTLRLLSQKDELATETLTFAPSSRVQTATNRTELNLVRRDVCHFEGDSRPFIPEDFHLKKRPSSSGTLTAILDRLSLITTLAYLSDVSSLSADGRFTYKLNGYKAITGGITNGAVSSELREEFFKIYAWAYSGGSAADKLGIARNIISLHWSGAANEAPDAGIYQSVISAHDVYLKKRVDQYLSLKKSLCDYLGELSQKSAKLAETFGDKMEKNFLGFVGFFVSTILLKAATEKNFPGFLPEHLQTIAWGLLGISIVHLFLSISFSRRERERVVEDFGLLKTRYADFLNKADLDKVLNEDDGLNRTLAHLDFKLRLFVAGWVLMLVICSILTLKLSIEPQKITKPLTKEAPARTP